MISTSPALGTLLDSGSSWEVTCRVTIDWGAVGVMDTTRLTPSVKIDRSVADAATDLGQITGGVAGEATITLSGEYLDTSGQLVRAAELSPYIDKPWSTRNLPHYGRGSAVAVDVGFTVNGAVEWIRRFTGYVTSVNPSSGGDVIITALDNRLRGKVDLPAAGGVVNAVPGGDPTISPLAIVDIALRSDGLCLTPPARPEAFVSATCCGSPLPEIGTYATFPFASPTVGGRWTPEVRSGGRARATGVTSVAGSWICVEGWVKRSWPGSGRTLLYQVSQGASTYDVYLLSTGAVSLALSGTAMAITSAAGAVSNDVSWHYVAAAWRTGTSGQAIIRVDATTTSVSVAVPTDFLDLVLNTQVTWGTVCEGLQAWQPTATPTWNNTWPGPNYVALMDRTPTRLAAVAAASKVSAWQLIQDVAQAEGAIAGFDESGAFRYETRESWHARRFATPGRVVAGDYLQSWGLSWSSEGERRAVSAPVHTPRVVQSTMSTPAWQATEVYTCPALRTVSYEVALSEPIFEIGDVMSRYQDSALYSFRNAVSREAVGDPAARSVLGVQILVRPTATGITITITNQNAFAIALWTPEQTTPNFIPEGPYLVLHGKKVTIPEPRTVTVLTGADVEDELILSDSMWRQSDTATAMVLDTLASECSMPAIVLDPIPIAGDPRIQLGDVITLDDSVITVDGVSVSNPHRFSDAPMPVTVIGVQEEISGAGYFTTLTGRAAYAPIGWVLDVAGRSELDATALLVI